jgi:hypothetical protein
VQIVVPVHLFRFGSDFTLRAIPLHSGGGVVGLGWINGGHASWEILEMWV